MRKSYEHGLLCRLSFIGLRLATVAGHIQCKQYIKSIGILYSVKIGNGLERLELLSLMKCNRFLVDFHKWNKQQESASLLTDVILNILFSADCWSPMFIYRCNISDHSLSLSTPVFLQSLAWKKGMISYPAKPSSQMMLIHAMSRIMGSVICIFQVLTFWFMGLWEKL